MSTKKLTVNELMSLMKVARDRLHTLKTLQQQVATLDRKFWKNAGEIESIVEPKYDVVDVDNKIVEIENFLFEADGKIKTTNARTVVDYDIDVAQLLAPLKKAQ